MAGYSVTFSVVDNATKQIDAINRRMTAMRAPMDRLSKQVSRFVDVSGLRTIERGFSSIASAAGKVLRSLVEIVPVMGALTGAATIGGMARLVQTYARWSQSLTSTADQLGISTQQLQRFEDATRLAGGNVADMDAALKSLYQAQTALARGQASADQIGWFNRLGINIRDANGHLRSMTDLMPEVISKIAAIQNPADRAAASAALLGDSNAKLVEAFRRSHESFTQWLTDASRYTELTKEQRDQLQSFSEAQGRAATAFDHLGQQISVVLARNFTPLLNHLSEFVEKHQPEIIAAVDNISNKFAAWLSGIKWSDVERGLNSIIQSLTWVATHLDQIKTAAEIVAGLFVVKWGVQAVAAVTQLVTALGTAGAGAGAAAGGTGLLGALGGVAAITAAIAVAGNQSRLGGAVAGASAGAATAGVPGAVAGAVGGALWKRPDWLPKWLDWTPGQAMHYLRTGEKPDGAAAPKGPVEQAAPGDMRQPRGIRNNNPGNLNFAYQPGAKLEAGSNARFASFGSMDQGVAALAHQLQLNQQKHGVETLRGQIERWAPPNENNTAAYINTVSKRTGLDPDAKLDTSNPETLKKLVNAVSWVENARTLDQNAVAKGVAEATGKLPPASAAPAATSPVVQVAAKAPPAAVPPANANLNGAVDVSITGKNLPPDSAVTARGSGSVNVAPPRVEHQDLMTV